MAERDDASVSRPRPRRGLFIAAAAALIVACASPSPKTAAPEPPSPSAAPPSSTAPPSTAAASAEPPAAAARAPDAPSPFHLALRGDADTGEVQLFATDGALFVAAPGIGLFARVQGEDVVFDPKLLAGLPVSTFGGTGMVPPSQIQELVGVPPGPAWLVVVPAADFRQNGWVFHHFVNGAWRTVARPSVPADTRWGALVRWGPRLLLWYNLARRSIVPDTLETFDGPPPPVLPRIGCNTPPSWLTVARSGELYVVGGSCEGGAPGQLLVFGRGARDPQRLALSFAPSVVLARSASDVVVLGEEQGGVGVTATFDGKALTVAALPGPKAQPVDGAMEPDGTAWALSFDVPFVWRRKDGAWTTVPLPPPWKPSDIVVVGPGDVWILARDETGAPGLLRLGEAPAGPPRSLPTRKAIFDAIVALRRDDVPYPSCGVTVKLVPAGTPRAAAVRAAFAKDADLGQFEVAETDDEGGGRVLSAQIPSMFLPKARKLLTPAERRAMRASCNE